MLDELRTLLMQLGLSAKEADVYLAMLELGPTSIQDIAEKAKVNRTTTYVQIEELMKHGLASNYDRMGKTYYTAEHPDRLRALVLTRMSEAELAKQQVEDALPKLKAIFNAIPDKPIVRFSEGGEAITRLREELMASGEPMLEFFAVDEDLIASASIHGEQRQQLTKQLAGTKVLFTIKPGCMPPFFDAKSNETRVVDYAKAPFSGELIIQSKRVLWVNLKQRGAAIVIEQADVAATMRALFLKAWEGAAPWQPPIGWGK